MEDKVWWTRKARIQSENRMLANHRIANFILLWYSLCSVSVSIWILKFSSSNPHTDVLFTIFSVFILSVSLFSANARYAERANAFKENYVALQILYENIKGETPSTNDIDEYKRLLSISENHGTSDDAKALINEVWSSEDPDKLTRSPKSIHYIRFVLSSTRRAAVTLTLVSLPLFLAFYSLNDAVCSK